MKTKILVQILTGVRPSLWKAITEELISKKKDQDHLKLWDIFQLWISYISSNVYENVTVIPPLKCFFAPKIMSRRVISWLYINQLCFYEKKQPRRASSFPRLFPVSGKGMGTGLREKGGKRDGSWRWGGGRVF